MAARLKSEQSGLFWAFLGLLIMFLFLDLLTEYMMQAGITKTQLGGGMLKTAFDQCWAIALLVASAGGRNLANKLAGPEPPPPAAAEGKVP